MALFETEFGRPLKTKEVAALTSLDTRLVRKYYLELGGVRVGSRILFFEKRLINALSKQHEIGKEEPLDRPGVSAKRKEEKKGVQNQESCTFMGGETEGVIEETDYSDPFGLLVT